MRYAIQSFIAVVASEECMKRITTDANCVVTRYASNRMLTTVRQVMTHADCDLTATSGRAPGYGSTPPPPSPPPLTPPAPTTPTHGLIELSGVGGPGRAPEGVG